ncbi:MAG: hypothetical protein OXG37_07470 [Actinomycetia bacterium]|nr:hypothetical protein [Actinomycetes bacterium]
MPIFAVAVRDDCPPAAIAEITSRVETEYPGCYQINGSLWLVHSDGIAETVAQATGIKGDSRVEGGSGVVFKMNSYAGFTARSLWDWLADAEAKG